MYRGVKGKNGKEVLKKIDGFHSYLDKPTGRIETDWITTKASRIKKRNVSLQHYEDNWDKIFKK
jgi:hypothetical protein